MDSRHARLARAQHDVGVYGHHLAIDEHVLDYELLAREVDVILEHCLFQRRKTCGIEGIVVLSPQVDVLLVSFIDAACHDALQEFHGCLFASGVVYHKRAPMVSFLPAALQDD